MRLGEIEFPGYVMNASGARGFFGEDYRLPHPSFLADWTGSIFVSKTTALHPRKGFMPMCEDGITPRERFPCCIIVKPIGGHVLNCVSLSGPGAKGLIMSGEWQERTEPFVISFMATADTFEERIIEWFQFITLMGRVKGAFRAPFAIEINISCPNVGHDATKLVHEAKHMLDVGRPLGVPFIVNINLLVTPGEAVEISRHPACAAVSQSNSIPWGAFPERIPWKKIFGSDTSPLVKRGFGLGGYSGPYALPILLDWIHAVRCASSGNQWLIAGGGIQSVNDAEAVCRVGHPILKGIKLGVVCIVRPWRVQPIIRRVNRHFESLDRTKRAKQGSAT